MRNAWEGVIWSFRKMSYFREIEGRISDFNDAVSFRIFFNDVSYHRRLEIKVLGLALEFTLLISELSDELILS
ncbi:hypothetical protein SAY87_029321 [Trapa incisa]|uniref:Uncharacterized protein n=1 Tax=Trapa incisa TaxID=236973 RepID=A0AAN7KCM5_9MYRT|nr:hypothetical protein SAY87_029321 [Trapa incisa]